MVEKNNCSPLCDPLEFEVYNNGYEDLLYCKTCSLLHKTNAENLKKKVIGLEKFNLNVEEIISKDVYKKNISECKSQIYKIINVAHIEPKKILDFGCGYGSFMFGCKELGYDVEGYDININFTNSLKKYFPTFNSTQDLLNQNRKNSYDLIFCRKVLNLTPNLYLDFLMFDKLLSNTGVLVILDHVKNLSKYKSIITQDNNNTVLLTKQSLQFYASNFELKTLFFQNDFGDIFMILKKDKNVKFNNKISLKTLKNIEKLSFFFMFLSKIKNIIKTIYHVFKRN